MLSYEVYVRSYSLSDVCIDFDGTACILFHNNDAVDFGLIPDIIYKALQLTKRYEPM